MKKTTFETENCQQEVRMFENFSQLALQGQLEDFWPHVSVLTQTVVDACMESLTRNGEEVQIKG